MGSRFREKPGVEGAASVEFKSARAQRLAASVIGQTVNAQEDAQREAERAAKEQSKALEDAAKAQADAAEAARAMSLRAGAAAGMKTETDIATGKRSIATHPDGAPVFTPKKIGAPVEIGTQSAQFTDPKTGVSQSAPASNPLIPDDGALGAMGGTSQAVIAQPFRNDRGQTIATAPNSTTDATTGREYVSRTNPATGEISKIATGIDQSRYDDVQRQKQYEAKAREIALRDNNVKQARMRFEPQFKPVADEWKAAKKNFDALPPLFTKEKENSPWQYTDPETGKTVTTWDEKEVQRNKDIRAQTEKRFAAASEAYDRMAPTAQNLERNEKEISAAKLKLDESRIRMESGLPEDDGGVAEILARVQSGEEVTQDEYDGALMTALDIDPRLWRFDGDSGQATARQYPEPPTVNDSLSVATPEPGTIIDERPLMPADPDKAAVVAEAFQGLVNPQEFTVGHTGEGYAFIKRNGEHVGRLVSEVGQKSLKRPVLVLNDNLNQNADIRQFIAFGGTKGLDVYLGSNARPDPVKEAEWTAGVFQSITQAQEAKQTPQQIDAIIKEAGADQLSIFRKVRKGELSIQRGEAIMRDLYGTTLKADDPLVPGAIDKFMIEQAEPALRDEWAIAKGRNDTARMNEATKQYLNQWYVENQMKPGVNFQSRLLAEQALMKGLRTGEKAGAIGTGALNVAGSMVGMLAAVPMLGTLKAMQAMGDETAGEAADAAWQAYGRGSKNTWRGWDYNRKRWLTDDGKARYKAFEAAGRDLQTKIRLRDMHTDGIDSPAWKAEYAASVKAVEDAAMSLHEMGLEKGWEITREDLERLSWMPNAYALTGDKSLLDAYFSALTEDHGTRQAAEFQAELTAGLNPFMAGVIGGTHAPPEEIGVEIVSTLMTFGASKALLGGAKTAEAIKAAQQGVAATGRLTKLRMAAHGLKDEFIALGTKADTLADPLSKGRKALNTTVQAGKVAVGSGISEAGEEAAMGLSERDATAGSVLESAGIGFLAGFVMAPVMGGLAVPIEAAKQRSMREQSARKFAEEYNKAGAGQEGFIPLSQKNALIAMSLSSPQQQAALQKDFKDAVQELATTSQAASQDNASDEALNAFSRAQQRVILARDNLATFAAARAEAVQAVEAMPAELRPIYGAAMKVATGRADLLTQAERAAAGGMRTESGQPFFANVGGVDVLTDEARADIAANAPAVGKLIETTESIAILNAQAEAMEPITPPVDASGAQGDPATGGVVPPHVSDASGQGVQFAKLAGMEALEYEIGRADDPSMPEVGEVVAAAVANGMPVSVSMANASGTDMAAQGYTREGTTWNPPVSSNTGPEENQATTGKTPENTPDKAKDGSAKDNSPQAIAARIQATVETAVPRLKGKISIVKNAKMANGQVFPTGGAFANPDGTISISLDDITREMRGIEEASFEKALTDLVLRHEVVHVVQYQAVHAMWQKAVADGSFEGGFPDFFRQWYGKIASELSAKTIETAADIYNGKTAKPWAKMKEKERAASTWGTIPTENQAAEIVRMLVEAKLNPDQAELFSELSRDIDFKSSTNLIAHLKAAVDMLIEMVKTGKLPESARVHVDELAAMYQELVGTSTEAETQETAKPDPNAPKTRVRIMGDAIAAVFRDYPKLTQKQYEDLYDKLEEISDELLDSLEGLTDADKSATIEREIRQWFEETRQTEQERQQEREEQELAAKTDEKSRKAREAAMERRSRITAKADKLLAGTKWLGEMVRQGIRIELPPNVIGLMMARKRQGKRLTQNEIDTLRSYTGGEYDGIPRQSQFPGGGRNEIMRNIVSRITARHGDTVATQPDKAAQAIGEPLGQEVDTSTFLQEIDRELRALSRGESIIDSRSPDFEGDAEAIAKADAAAQAAMEAEEAAQAPLPTLPEIVTALEQEYGENADLPAKLRVIEPILSRFPEPQQQAIIKAAMEEEQRIAYGVISAERWQEMNPGLNDTFAGWFQRFLDNQTPKSLKAKLAQLLRPEAQAKLEGMRLASSPSVSPAMDAAYLAAVEAGDIGTAQRMVDEAASKAGGRQVLEDEDIDPNEISPRNALDTNRLPQVEKQAEIMREKGWVGRPLLIYYGPNGYESLTGSHRLAAASEAELDTIPVVIIKEEALEGLGEWIEDGNSSFLDLIGFLNGREFDQLETLQEAREAGIEGLDDAIDLMFIEDESNWQDADMRQFLHRDPWIIGSQIKSADPVTRDESGNVIPLSQRFNPQSDSILFSSPSTGFFDFGATGEMGDKSQMGLNFDGPRAKAKANAQAAFDKLPQDSLGRARIAGDIARREGLADTKEFVKQATQPAFGFNDTTAGTRDQLGLFSSASQRAFDFGTSGSFSTRNQAGFDFGEKATPERTQTAPKSPQSVEPQGKEKDNAKDTSHLDALELGLSRERERLRSAKTDKEKRQREVWIGQIEREVAAEREFLGLPPATETTAQSDQELLDALLGDGTQPAPQDTAKPANPPQALAKGDRFTDAQGNTWEVWSVRHGNLQAHPVVDGKPMVNNQTGEMWATTEESRLRNPEYRTDITPATTPQGGTKQNVPAPDFLEVFTGTKQEVAARNPGVRLAIGRGANSQRYTLWQQVGNGRWDYLRTLPTDRAVAMETAVQVARDIASGTGAKYAFTGGKTRQPTAEEIARGVAVQTGILTTSDLEEVSTRDSIPIQKQEVGFGKYAGTLVGDLYATDPDYTMWLYGSANRGRALEIKAYLDRDLDFLAAKDADVAKNQEEQDRIRAAEEKMRQKREAPKQQKPAEAAPASTGETTPTPAKKPTEKLTRRKANEQFVELLAPLTGIADVLPDNLKTQMFPMQQTGANAAIAALDESGAFLNGDGAGVGKTRQILAIASHYAAQGKPVVIITENAAIGKPWEGTGTPAIGGSMAKDSEAMGVDIELMPDDGTAAKGKVRVTTYHRVTADQIPAGTVVIFDESQNLANIYGDISKETGNWKEKFGKIFAAAEKTAYYSATPADKPHQLAYLFRALGFTSPEAYLDEAKANGMITRIRMFGRTEQKAYDVPSSNAGRQKLYAWVNGKMMQAGRDGRFIKREISYEGTDIQFHDTKGTDETANPWAEQFNQVMADMAAFQNAEWQLLAPRSYTLYAAELTKIGDAVRMAKRELAAGRKVVIYFSRIKEMKIRGRKWYTNAAGEREPGPDTDLGTIPSPVDMLKAELVREMIDFTELHGQSGTTSKKAQDRFSKDVDVLLASVESGGTGINLDDTTGNNPRTEVFMFAPYRGISTIQAMGRIWRASTIQDDNNPNRYVFVVASDIPADLQRNTVLAKKIQLMNATLGGTAVSKLPMSKVSFESEQLVGLELPEEGERSNVEKGELSTAPLKPVNLPWKLAKSGRTWWAKANADLLEWIADDGAERTGLAIKVKKDSWDGYVAFAESNYKPEEFTQDVGGIALFSAPSIGNQGFFDFGTESSFDTKNQLGFLFGQEEVKRAEQEQTSPTPPEAPEPAIVSPQPGTPEFKLLPQETKKEIFTDAKERADDRRKGITDFGEKIGGARKDYAQTFEEAKSLDIASEPFSKVWPEPDYAKLVEQGGDPWTIGFIRAMRDEVPPKPRQPWKLSRYVRQVTMLRDMAESILAGEYSKDTIQDLIKSGQYSTLDEAIAGAADLYAEVGHGQSLKGIRFAHVFYGLYRGEKNIWKWEVTKRAKATAFSNMPQTIAEGNTRVEALERFKEAIGKRKEQGKPKIKFDIYRYTAKDAKPGFIIGKKIGRHHADLFTFETAKEAREYLMENYDDVVARLEAYKKIGQERRTENAPRVGADHRQGRDVTPQMFQKAFSFRGVEFGNYVEQKRRQSDLNRAYESLMDLAAILNIPPQALSLDSTLGLAFGARGSGGKNAPAAHYEPGKIAINLTKNNGPGSLAHEWFHAMDNYFLRQVGKPADFATAQKRGTWGGRMEVMEAFGNIIRTIDKSGLRKRSALLDKKRSSPYWSTDIELSARAFENYVIERLKAMQASNDYLANISDISEYAESMIEAFFDGNTAEDLYPYLTEEETGPVVEAFDNLFATIQTKETDRGIALFSSPSPQAVRSYLDSNGTRPDDAARESERVSAALAPNRPNRLAEDGNSYSQGDFFAPEQPEAPSQGQQIADAGSRALARAKAKPGRDSVSDDLIRGISGDWEALAREVDARGSASSILSDLITREIPVWNVNGTILDSPEAVHAVMLPIRSPYFESLKVVVLDGNLKAVHSQILTVGALAETTLHPAEIFGTLARLREINGKKYSTLVFSHNHPSGDPSPSRADEIATRRINQVAEMAGWQILDHVITNGEKYYSFRESGIIGATTLNETPYTPRKDKGTQVPAISKEDRQAPWEVVKRSAIRQLDTPERIAELAKHLRNANPEAAHLLYVNTRFGLLAIERVDLVDVLNPERLTRKLIAARGREGAYGFIVDYPFGKTSQEILVNRVNKVADVLGIKFLDAFSMWGEGRYDSARETGVLQESPPALASSPSQTPDLFTAATAPDASKKLGDVKVGRMHALTAYRSLTGKRAAGKALTATEEQQLLDAEIALGQKLAFDMEALKATAPEAEAELSEQDALRKWVRDNPGQAPLNDDQKKLLASIERRKAIGGQSEMMMGGETERGGQMRLFSSPARWPSNLYAYTYRKEAQRGDVKHIVRTYNERTGLKEDRVFDTLAEAQAEMRSLDEKNKPVTDPAEIAALLGLASAPTPEDMDAIEQALSKMKPIFRAVFEAVNDGIPPDQVMSKFNLSEKAVTNILNAVRSRVVIATKAQAGTLKAVKNEDGLFVDNRPDVAEGGKEPFVAVDQIRNESGVKPGERGYVTEERRQLAIRTLNADYEGNFARLENMERDGVLPDDLDVFMAQEIFEQEVMSGRINDPARATRVALFRVAYRDEGTAQSDAFRARIDRKMTPAQRNAVSYMELLYEPSPEVRARIKKAKGDKPTQDAILKQWMDKINAFKAEMKAEGYDIDASLKAFNEREAARKEAEADNPRTTEVLNEVFRKLSKLEKTVVEAIKAGSMFETAAQLVGLTEADAERIYTSWYEKSLLAMKEAAKRYRDATLASSPTGNVMEDIMSELGFPPPRLVPRNKADVPRVEALKESLKPRKPKTPKPDTGAKTEAEKMLGIGDKPLTDKQKAAIERFVNSPPSTWKAIRQETAALFPQAEGFPESYEEGENARRIMGGLLFPEKINEETGEWDETRPFTGQGQLLREPINETTGTFNMADPAPMAYLANELASRNGSWINKLTEFYKMAILSGPQTMLVNASGGLFLAHELTTKRAVEAAWNDLLGMFGAGDVRSATLSEFLPMLKQVRAAMKEAAKQALQSWRLQSPVFEEYAKAKPIQTDFIGTGSEFSAPALETRSPRQFMADPKAKDIHKMLNWFLKAITFRELTMVDEFWKTMYANMDAAAIAHRIAAKEEKLTGKAYADRVKELMERGSEAWLRTISRAKRVTFQDALAYGKFTAEDQAKNPNHKKGFPMSWEQAKKKSETESAWTLLDAVAAKAMEARKTPFLGPLLHMFALPFIVTPKNIIQRGLEVTPLGLVVDVIDGMRSLRRRVISGQITKKESNRIAGELYNKARFIQTLTNQSLGLMIYFAAEALSDDDEEDEYGRPIITGTLPWSATKKGERDTAMAVMPPQSIRIGDTIIPYGRIEPFATAISALVDMAVSQRRNDSLFNSQVLTDTVVGFKSQFQDKLFLKGLGDLLRVAEDPRRGADRLAASWITGFVPNLVRQPIRELDPVIRDKNPQANDGILTAIAKRVGYELVPQSAPPKYSIWGKEIPSAPGAPLANSEIADGIFRVLDPLNVRFGASSGINPIDAWIRYYNDIQPTSTTRIGIEVPDDEITIPGTKPGDRPRKIALTEDEKILRIQNVGKKAEEFLMQFDWDVKTATDADAGQKDKLIKDTFTRFKTEETERIKMEKLAAMSGGE